MNEPTLKDVAEKLLARTAAGDLKWLETPDEDAFRIVFRAGLIRIEGREEKGLFTQEIFRIVLVDQNARELETLSGRPGQESFPVLRDLYLTAKRSALGVNVKLRQILGDIDAGAVVLPEIGEEREEEELL